MPAQLATQLSAVDKKKDTSKSSWPCDLAWRRCRLLHTLRQTMSVATVRACVLECAVGCNRTLHHEVPGVTNACHVSHAVRVVVACCMWVRFWFACARWYLGTRRARRLPALTVRPVSVCLCALACAVTYTWTLLMDGAWRPGRRRSAPAVNERKRWVCHVSVDRCGSSYSSTRR